MRLSFVNVLPPAPLHMRARVCVYTQKSRNKETCKCIYMINIKTKKYLLNMLSHTIARSPLPPLLPTHTRVSLYMTQGHVCAYTFI